MTLMLLNVSTYSQSTQSGISVLGISNLRGNGDYFKSRPVTLHHTEGDSPLLDIADQASINTSRDGRELGKGN